MKYKDDNSTLTEDKCPGCGVKVAWDHGNRWFDGEAVADCPGCGATLYAFGTAECCYRVKLSSKR